MPAVAQQSKAADTPAQWQYSREDDPLHGKVHDRFILDGVYLTPPHLSTDGQSAFFTRIDLKGVLSARQVIVGVYEYMGTQVVMRFDIPDPAPVMEKCGEDRILKMRGKKGK